MKFAFRQLAKSPGFTFGAVVTLALGIGATTAIFSVVNTVLLRPLEYAEPNRIVTAWSLNLKTGHRYNVSGPDFRDWHDQSRSFAAISTFASGDLSTQLDDHTAEKNKVAAIGADFFTALGVRPLVGRVFTAEESHSAALAIVGETFARRHFPGDPAAVLGRTLRVRGKPLEIIGVIPARIAYPDQAEVWTPSHTIFFESPYRSGHNYRVIARLAPGVALSQAQAELDGIAARLAQQHPDSNTNKGARLLPLHDLLVSRYRSTLWIMFGAVGLVLCIACANVANLLLARGLGRAHEMALRAALGASRSRIVRQLLTESLALALLGGGLGVVIAKLGLGAFLALAPAGLPRIEEIGLDGGTLAFALLASLAVCVATGLVPAFHASHVNLNHALRASGRGLVAGRSSLRSALVVAQLGLSLVLLTGAGLLLRSFQLLNAVDPGYRPEKLLVMEANFPAEGKEGAERAVAFYADFAREAATLPGVAAVSYAPALPVDAGGPTSGGLHLIEGRPKPAPADMAHSSSSWRVVGPDYFSALGIAVRAGRALDARDTAHAPLTAVINESLARAHWPDASPLGHRIWIGWDSVDKWFTIVGVVADTKSGSLDAPSRKEVYVPVAQHSSLAASMKVFARTALPPAGLAESFRQIARRLNPAVPVKFTTGELILADTLTTQRFRSLLIGIFAGVALLLAAIGLYSVLAYGVVQRTAEIGVRMALGAQRGQVLALIMRGGFKLVILGLLAGGVASLALSRLLTSFLFGVQPLDPLVYGGVAALFAGIAAFACWLPARRATQVDPMAALRAE
jgi:predicted permease